MKKTLLHQTAIIDPKAQLASDAEVGPYTVIGPEVKIGTGTVVGNMVTLQGKTTIGANNRIGAYSSIGMPAQDKEHWVDDCLVEIGDHNDIREYVSIHRGTFKHGEPGVTKIGSHNQIMVYCHFAHDTLLGDHCMLANNSTLGGHVRFGSHIVTGGLSAYHQFTQVGSYAMVGGMTACFQDVPPYCLCTGPRGMLYGINRVGLARNGFSPEQVGQIQELYNRYFSGNKVPSQMLKELLEEANPPEVWGLFLEFVQNSVRGVAPKG